ncbi:class I SAM-dependent methyltransferase [Alteromonas sp. NFXS44]|uniref:class I SAM-dependent methyltransferase n=1 Tax=Alteromonas sp. NFXS44 TaxID=2818435 RepID=UPI0032DEB801
MPDIEWNKSWIGNLKEFSRGQLSGDNYGDQWGNPHENKLLIELVEKHIVPFLNSDTCVLEIGCGGGRWTQFFLDCKEVYCVDLNHEMLDYTKERFPGASNLNFIKTNGSDIAGVRNESVDFLFTFGTFVHLDFAIIQSYMENIKPLMKDGGFFSIQFSNKSKPMAKTNPDFSENSPEKMSKLLSGLGFVPQNIDDELLPHSTVISGQYRK